MRRKDVLPFGASPLSPPHICQLQLEVMNVEQRHEVALVRGMHVPEYPGQGQSFPLCPGMKMLCFGAFAGLMMLYLCVIN